MGREGEKDSNQQQGGWTQDDECAIGRPEHQVSVRLSWGRSIYVMGLQT